MPLVERHIQVHRTARFYVLGTLGQHTRELWVACHGYGQLAANFGQALEPLGDDTRAVVVPEALSRFYLDDPAKKHGPASPIGASWMTREDREREIADHVEYLDTLTSELRREAGNEGLPVTALGFSQGVATVARWAALGRTEVRHLILWAGSVPPDLPKDRGGRLFRGASLVLVAGQRDLLVTPLAAERAREDLAGRGLPTRVITYDGGHSLNTTVLRQLAGEISSGA